MSTATRFIGRRTLLLIMVALLLVPQLLIVGFGAQRALADSTPPELISKATDSEPGDGLSYGAQVSDNGRYVAFASDSTNLGTQGANAYGQGIYVHDRQTGVTTLESVDSNGQQENGSLNGYTLSGDGRYLAFITNANNMDPSSQGVNSSKFSVYLRNLGIGVTTVASIDNNGQRLYPSFGGFGNVSLSYDGSVAVFVSNSYSELLPDIYIRDISNARTEQVANQLPQTPKISGDGNKVLYTSARQTGSGNSPVFDRVMVYDRSTGMSTAARFNPDGSTDVRFAMANSISFDGRYVTATGEGCGENNTCIFRSDLVNHVTKKLFNVSYCGGSYDISSDGSLAAVAESSPSDILGECIGVPQAYIYNINTDTKYRVSNNAAGDAADSEVQEPSMNADGTIIAFTTEASNFGAEHSQVFAVTNVGTGTTDMTPPSTGTPIWSQNPKPTSGTATLTIPAADDTSGVASGEYFLGDADPGQGNGAAMDFDGTNLTTTFGTDFPTGVYKVTVRAVDNAGNWSEPVSDYLVVYNPDGPRMTGKRTVVPSLANSDVLPGLINTSQNDKATFAFNVKYNNQGQISGNSDLQFRYKTGTHCNGNSPQNCHRLELNATSIAWLTTQGINDSTGIFQGTATMEVDGQTSTVQFRVTGLDGQRLDPESDDRFMLKIYAEGANPNTDEPLYQVSSVVTRGNIRIIF